MKIELIPFEAGFYEQYGLRQSGVTQLVMTPRDVTWTTSDGHTEVKHLTPSIPMALRVTEELYESNMPKEGKP